MTGYRRSAQSNFCDPGQGIAGSGANLRLFLAAVAFGPWLTSSLPGRRPGHPAMACPRSPGPS
jgi:hypothetical protein